MPILRTLCVHTSSRASQIKGSASSSVTLICSSAVHSEFINYWGFPLIGSRCSSQSFSCPFDYVKVFDGSDNSSALIGTYCGQQRNLVLYGHRIILQLIHTWPELFHPPSTLQILQRIELVCTIFYTATHSQHAKPRIQGNLRV